jgi:predicted SnoaL-like aldol condensation-catalyzing enzyme
MGRKESAIEFLRLAGGGRAREAFDRFVASGFFHHNQYFRGDRESLLLAMEEASRKSPNKSLTVKHVYEDGETVITHSHVVRRAEGDPGIAVVHIFRFEGDRVAELWDLGQLLDKESPNENGPF